MASLTGFNASQVEPASSFEPIPAGKYPAVITESEMKPTKSSQGQYLQLTFQIIDGPFRGRLLWARLNLVNPNATTVQIARGELSAICRAVGVLTPADSTELHNLPLIIAVRLKKRQDNGELTNEIKGYERPAPGNAPAPGAAPGSGSVPPPPPPSRPSAPASGATAANGANPYAGTTPPWRR